MQQHYIVIKSINITVYIVKRQNILSKNTLVTGHLNLHILRYVNTCNVNVEKYVKHRKNARSMLNTIFHLPATACLLEGAAS